MKEKGVVFGAGFLGTRIAQELDYTPIPRKLVDASDTEQVKLFFDSFKPDVVINAVGKTGGPGAIGIDYCFLHPEESYSSNVTAAINLAREARKRGVYFVHLGSGCVYDGDYFGWGWNENILPNFTGQTYSEHKQIAEKIMREEELGGLIVRLRMPLDNRPDPRNLITKGISNLKAGRGVIKIQNSMTTVPHMIRAIDYMIKQRADGIYNFTNPRTISLYNIMDLAKDMQILPNKEIKEMTESELMKVVIQPRSNCMLNTNKLGRFLPTEFQLPEIHEGVRQCLEEYKNKMNEI